MAERTVQLALDAQHLVVVAAHHDLFQPNMLGACGRHAEGFEGHAVHSLFLRRRLHVLEERILLSRMMWAALAAKLRSLTRQGLEPHGVHLRLAACVLQGDVHLPI